MTLKNPYNLTISNVVIASQPCTENCGVPCGGIDLLDRPFFLTITFTLTDNSLSWNVNDLEVVFNTPIVVNGQTLTIVSQQINSPTPALTPGKPVTGTITTNAFCCTFNLGPEAIRQETKPSLITGSFYLQDKITQQTLSNSVTLAQYLPPTCQGTATSNPPFSNNPYERPNIPFNRPIYPGGPI